MKKKVIFICEGQTELFFCEKLLKTHFSDFDIEIEYHIISHSNGGIVKWKHLKKQIEDTLSIEGEAFVTTFIDYYGMEYHHDFPEWDTSLAEANKVNRMVILENAMLEDINPSFKSRFIPYIQLHEFEAYVFSDYNAFVNYYMPREANFTALQAICNDYPNPEEINDDILTAPSKRLDNNIYRYDKISQGVEICELIKLQGIRSKCPRFNNWIDKIENI
jgi:hypothetical protein